MPVQPFTLPSITPGLPSYENIIKVLQSPTPTQSQFLPEIQSILGGSSEFLKPAIESLRQNLSGGIAGLEGDFSRRGLTGSSIEAQALGTARGQGAHAEAGLVGNFAMQGASHFADILARARAGDVDASQQLRVLIAQAMGQELGSERNQAMFERGLSFQGDQASKARNAALLNSLLGLGGQATMAAGYAGGFPALMGL